MSRIKNIASIHRIDRVFVASRIVVQQMQSDLKCP